MRTPTKEQDTILTDQSRVRIVRAAPGSGKTTLVCMIIRKEIEATPFSSKGIAALSFTRVGSDEIRKEVGYPLTHPHFVGTIDSFLFRYVIRPFLKKVWPDWAKPRLLPAEWSANEWGKGPDSISWKRLVTESGKPRAFNLFNVSYIGEKADKAILVYPRKFRDFEVVNDQTRDELMNAKKDIWKKLGWYTHADTALVASRLLENAVLAPAIRSLILSRFPLLIIDELQDTGFFLAKCIRSLINEAKSRAVLVGDPNQAIYEFNGARPELFKNFESIPGATPLPLGNSQRCPSKIVAVASHMKGSDDLFQSSAEIIIEGRAYLVPYSHMLNDIQELVLKVLSKNPDGAIKVIARQNNTIDELTARSANRANSLNSPVLHHLYCSVHHFRQGNNSQALARAIATLDLAVFGHEGVTEEKILSHGYEVSEWRKLAVSILLQCNNINRQLTLLLWQTQASVILKNALGTFAAKFPLLPSFQIRPPQKRNKHAVLVEKLLPNPTINEVTPTIVPFLTVHKVKGETHDVTIFVTPPPKKTTHCPSNVWWSDLPEHIEERRIAFVAMTRTRGDLILCVSEPTYQNLQKDRSDFVSAFQCVTLPDFLGTY